MNDMIGRTLGPYRVLEQLGMGGMATVYKAYHPAMNRYVAIKVLPPHLARDPNFRVRFQRETHAIARLEHRYILPVYDVGEDEGIPYLVMRYTTGGTFGDLIAQHTLPLAQAVKVVRQIAEALEYAHDHSIIHRDIKPANILIAHDGNALLSDFGIAKIIEGTLNLTGEGMLIGTPFYMAPEQVRGQNADPRSDIYALGVVLYEATTGQRPFDAETPLAVALMHVHNPLPVPTNVNAAIPESLERVILKALAKEASDRFQTAADMATALRQVELELQTSPLNERKAAPTTVVVSTTQTPATTGSPQPLSKRWPSRWLGIAAVTIVGIVAAAVWLWPRATPAGSSATSAPAIRASAPTGLAAQVNTLALQGNNVWAATVGGLVRWDSSLTAQVFASTNGLPFEDDEVQAIVVAADGTLWLGGGGVAHLRPDGNRLSDITFYTSDDGLGTPVVRAMMSDKDGTIWAGGPRNGEQSPISHFDGTRWRTDELPMNDPALNNLELNVRALFRSSDGALWVGLDRDGIVRWDGQRWTYFGPDQGVLAPTSDVADVRIRRFAQDAQGVVWAAGTDRGLLRFDAIQSRWQSISVANVRRIRGITATLDGNLWATGDYFIARSTNNGRDWESMGANDSTVGIDVSALVQDPQGRVWIGSYSHGVSIFNGTQWQPLQR